MSLILKFDAGDIESIDTRVDPIPSPGRANTTNILRRLDIYNPDTVAFQIEYGFVGIDAVTREEIEWKRGPQIALPADTMVSLTDELYIKDPWSFYFYIRQDATAYRTPFYWWCHWAESGPT